MKIKIKIENKPDIVLDKLTVQCIVCEWYLNGMEPEIFMNGSVEIDEWLETEIFKSENLPQIETIV
jgi:hypothetical protein